MFDTNILLAGVLFGSIGTGYFIYGKKAPSIMFLITGLILIIYPYFITNIYYMVIVGIILLILPFIIRA